MYTQQYSCTDEFVGPEHLDKDLLSATVRGGSRATVTSKMGRFVIIVNGF